MESHDVLVPQIAHGPGFTYKALTRLRDLIRRESRETEFLYSNVTADTRIQCPVDDSTRAAPDFLENLILPDPPHGVRGLVVGRRRWARFSSQVWNPFEPCYRLFQISSEQ